jgi:hypothetical protein
MIGVFGNNFLQSTFQNIYFFLVKGQFIAPQVVLVMEVGQINILFAIRSCHGILFLLVKNDFSPAMVLVVKPSVA